MGTKIIQFHNIYADIHNVTDKNRIKKETWPFAKFLFFGFNTLRVIGRKNAID